MLSIYFIISLCLIGVFAGLASGLLGVGGGFLLVPLQYFLLSSFGVDDSLAMMVALGTSLAIIIPTALSGAYQHQKKNKNIIKPGIQLGLFGILGSFFGGLLANIIPSGILRFIFGILLFIVAIDMLVSFKREGNGGVLKFNKLNIICLGILIGLLSGLLGIGGGIFLVPVLSLLFGFTLIQAIATSSVFIALTAIGGVISYVYSGFNVNVMPFSIGYINLINLIFIILFSIPFASIGANLAYKIPDKKLKQIFSIILFYMGIKMMGFDLVSFIISLF